MAGIFACKFRFSVRCCLVNPTDFDWRESSPGKRSRGTSVLTCGIGPSTPNLANSYGVCIWKVSRHGLAARSYDLFPAPRSAWTTQRPLHHISNASAHMVAHFGGRLTRPLRSCRLTSSSRFRIEDSHCIHDLRGCEMRISHGRGD
jgi:hypothetical protein